MIIAPLTATISLTHESPADQSST